MPGSDDPIGWLSGLIPSVASQIGGLIPESSPLADSVSHPAVTTTSTPNVSPSTSPRHTSVPTPPATAIGPPPAPSSSPSPPTAPAISLSQPPLLTTTVILTSQPSIVVSSVSTPQSTSVLPRPNSGAVAGIVLGACTAAICLVLASRWYMKRRRRGSSVVLLDPFMDPGTLHADAYLDGNRRGRTVEDVCAQMDASPVTQAASAHVMPCVPHSRRDSVSEVIPSQYVLPELRYIPAVDTPTSVGYEFERRGGTWYETHGGMRLSGEPPGEMVVDDSDQQSATDGSALPPPYSSHFGERRDVECFPLLVPPGRVVIRNERRRGVEEALGDGTSSTKAARGWGFVIWTADP